MSSYCPKRYVKFCNGNVLGSTASASLPAAGPSSGSPQTHYLTETGFTYWNGTEWVDCCDGGPVPSPLFVEGTQAEILALRDAGALEVGQHYIITNHTQGTLGDARILLHAVSESSLSMNAMVETSFSLTAYAGFYDIDAAVLFELRDVAGNVAITADSVSTFPWANPNVNGTRLNAARLATGDVTFTNAEFSFERYDFSGSRGDVIQSRFRGGSHSLQNTEVNIKDSDIDFGTIEANGARLVDLDRTRMQGTSMLEIAADAILSLNNSEVVQNGRIVVEAGQFEADGLFALHNSTGSIGANVMHTSGGTNEVNQSTLDSTQISFDAASADNLVSYTAGTGTSQVYFRASRGNQLRESALASDAQLYYSDVTNALVLFSDFMSDSATTLEACNDNDIYYCHMNSNASLSMEQNADNFQIYESTLMAGAKLTVRDSTGGADLREVALGADYDATFVVTSTTRGQAGFGDNLGGNSLAGVPSGTSTNTRNY